ncbi:MAG: hypothetical protein FWB88_10825 [Defluviitaleaceae bacterium]|nr:hypothetical protein [Defluviitaleaceae bacterium]MCL2240083.1 hypothetical protein [Defluviitaleaceae bacterium]MCL2240298.1 hypothetical protein [Defluviitaleaceae bacterium]
MRAFILIFFAVLVIFQIVMAVVNFMGGGASFYIGTVGSARRVAIDERKYLRFLGWIQLAGAALLAGAWILFVTEAVEVPFIMPVFMWGTGMLNVANSYLHTHKRFRKDPAAPAPVGQLYFDLTEGQIRRRLFAWAGVYTVLSSFLLLLYFST